MSAGDFAGWFRPVVSIVELYRTKRGEPVGDATLACGHKVLVDMNKRPPVRRVCWTCKREGRRGYLVARAAGEER